MQNEHQRVMYYKKILPIPELQPFINWFYVLECRVSGEAVVPLPATANPCCAMVFNYGDLYRLTNKYHSADLLPRQFLSGFSTEPYTLGLSGTVASLGVIFRTQAFRDIIALPDLGEWTDRRLDLDLVAGRTFDGLLDELAVAPTPERKVQIANRYFLKLFRPRLAESRNISDLITSEILSRRGFVSMDELASHFCITPRHLRRLFKERVGVSPKFYARVKRFGYTHFCNAGEKFDWRRFIGAYGYYDQAHLIREYKVFSGVTPTLMSIPDWTDHHNR